MEKDKPFINTKSIFFFIQVNNKLLRRHPFMHIILYTYVPHIHLRSTKREYINGVLLDKL